MVWSPTGDCGVGLVLGKETLTKLTRSPSESRVLQVVVNGSINYYCGNFELSSSYSVPFKDYTKSCFSVSNIRRNGRLVRFTIMVVTHPLAGFPSGSVWD